MTKEELQKIIEYINQEIKDCISTDDSETNQEILNGFFKEKEFIDSGIVVIDSCSKINK